MSALDNSFCKALLCTTPMIYWRCPVADHDWPKATFGRQHRLQVRGRRDMAFITKAFELVDDNDHRALAITMQAQGLDDAWTALLGSTLEVNRTVRSVNLNR